MSRKDRMCAACKAPCPLRYGIPDPCLGEIPEVVGACCGHGGADEPYVKLKSGVTFYGQAAIDWLLANGGNPAPITMPRRSGSLRGWPIRKGE